MKDDVIDAEIIDETVENGSTLKNHQKKLSTKLMRAGKVSDLWKGDLYAFQRGALRILSAIPGLRKTVEDVKPTQMLDNNLAQYTEMEVALGRSIAASKERASEIDGAIRHFRRVIKRSSTLLPAYSRIEDGEEKGLIPDLKTRIAAIDANLKTLGYDPTDPDLSIRMTEEMRAYVTQSTELKGVLGIYTRRASMHRARLTVKTQGIDELAAGKRSVESTLCAAEEKLMIVRVRAQTAQEVAKTTAYNLRLQEAIYGAHDKEASLRMTLNGLTIMIAEANKDLTRVLEESKIPMIDPRVLAYSDRAAARLTADLNTFRLEAPRTQSVLGAAYKELGASPGQTAEELQTVYDERTATATPEERARINDAFSVLVPKPETQQKYLPG